MVAGLFIRQHRRFKNGKWHRHYSVVENRRCANGQQVQRQMRHGFGDDLIGRPCRAHILSHADMPGALKCGHCFRQRHDVSMHLDDTDTALREHTG